MQQQVLESMVSLDQARSDAPEQVLNDVFANLVLYAGYSGFDISDDVRRKLVKLIAAAFPDWDAAMIERALEL